MELQARFEKETRKQDRRRRREEAREERREASWRREVEGERARHGAASAEALGWERLRLDERLDFLESWDPLLIALGMVTLAVCSLIIVFEMEWDGEAGLGIWLCAYGASCIAFFASVPVLRRARRSLDARIAAIDEELERRRACPAPFGGGEGR